MKLGLIALLAVAMGTLTPLVALAVVLALAVHPAMWATVAALVVALGVIGYTIAAKIGEL